MKAGVSYFAGIHKTSECILVLTTIVLYTILIVSVVNAITDFYFAVSVIVTLGDYHYCLVTWSARKLINNLPLKMGIFNIYKHKLYFLWWAASYFISSIKLHL